jgi:hypothetical protein
MDVKGDCFKEGEPVKGGVWANRGEYYRSTFYENVGIRTSNGG